MAVIEDILRSFGINRCYKGFDHVAYAILLAVNNCGCLTAVTREIYMETASHFGCEWPAIERNIRTVVGRAWKLNPTLLSQMAGYSLTRMPTASEFIEIIASYIIRTSRPQS